MTPIGYFHTASKYPYEARRQATAEAANARGEIHLQPGRDLEQAVADLEGFERIWILFEFHHNQEWKPKVMPPRGPRKKRGVFATRAPYRPNPLGLSCVRLLNINGLRVIVEDHDLLDGTPVLDIKPYLPYADAFPESKTGWLEDVESDRWQIDFSSHASAQIQWLAERGVSQLEGFVRGQLEFAPLDQKRKRVEILGDLNRLCYRTWRIDFAADEGSRKIMIHAIQSGYSNEDLAEPTDPHGDKHLHREFISKY